MFWISTSFCLKMSVIQVEEIILCWKKISLIGIQIWDYIIFILSCCFILGLERDVKVSLIVFWSMMYLWIDFPEVKVTVFYN